LKPPTFEYAEYSKRRTADQVKEYRMQAWRKRKRMGGKE
jgi:hypothetical protein